MDLQAQLLDRVPAADPALPLPPLADSGSTARLEAAIAGMAELHIARESREAAASGGVPRVHRDNLRLMTDLIKGAPKFRGEQKEYLLYKQAMKAYLKRVAVPEEVGIGVAIGGLEGDAAHYLGSYGEEPDSLEELWAILDGEFKICDDIRMRELLCIK